MTKQENVFWTLSGVSDRLRYWADKLYKAANQRKSKDGYEALAGAEKTLQHAATLNLTHDDVIDGEPIVPVEKGWVDSRKFCHCCGAWRRLEPLRCEISTTHDIVHVAKYKTLCRPPGVIYEMSPSLIASAGVYRNGGTCDDHHICTNCLELGLRHVRDRINEMLGETDCIPVPVVPLSNLAENLVPSIPEAL